MCVTSLISFIFSYHFSGSWYESAGLVRQQKRSRQREVRRQCNRQRDRKQFCQCLLRSRFAVAHWCHLLVCPGRNPQTPLLTTKFSFSIINKCLSVHRANAMLTHCCRIFLQGKQFEVQAGSLSFSVGCYAAVSFVGIAILMARRMLPMFGRGELGGPTTTKYISAIVMIILWVLYIVLSSLEALQIIKI